MVLASTTVRHTAAMAADLQSASIQISTDAAAVGDTLITVLYVADVSVTSGTAGAGSFVLPAGWSVVSCESMVPTGDPRRLSGVVLVVQKTVTVAGTDVSIFRWPSVQWRPMKLYKTWSKLTDGSRLTTHMQHTGSITTLRFTGVRGVKSTVTSRRANQPAVYPSLSTDYSVSGHVLRIGALKQAKAVGSLLATGMTQRALFGPLDWGGIDIPVTGQTSMMISTTDITSVSTVPEAAASMVGDGFTESVLIATTVKPQVAWMTPTPGTVDLTRPLPVSWTAPSDGTQRGVALYRESPPGSGSNIQWWNGTAWQAGSVLVNPKVEQTATLPGFAATSGTAYRFLLATWLTSSPDLSDYATLDLTHRVTPAAPTVTLSPAPVSGVVASRVPTLSATGATTDGGPIVGWETQWVTDAGGLLGDRMVPMTGPHPSGTIKAVTNPAADFPSGVGVGWSDPRLTHFAGAPVASGVSGDTGCWVKTSGSTDPGSNFFRTTITSTKLGVIVNAYDPAGVDVSVYVDGKLVGHATDPFVAPAGQQVVVVEGLTDTAHDVQVVVGWGATLVGLIVLPSATVTAGAALPLRIGIDGDSYFASGLKPYFAGMAREVHRLTGWAPVQLAQGSTGYTNDGASSGNLSKSAFGSGGRLTALRAAGVDVLLVGGSVNDGATDPAVVKAAAKRFYADAAPLPVIVAGVEPLTLPTDPGTAWDAANTAILEAAAEAPNVVGVIDWRGEDWLTGTGSVSAPKGDGNQDLYIGLADGSDTVHPNLAGMRYLAGRLVSKMGGMRLTTDAPVLLQSGTTVPWTLLKALPNDTQVRARARFVQGGGMWSDWAELPVTITVPKPAAPATVFATVTHPVSGLPLPQLTVTAAAGLTVRVERGGAVIGEVVSPGPTVSIVDLAAPSGPVTWTVTTLSSTPYAERSQPTTITGTVTSQGGWLFDPTRPETAVLPRVRELGDVSRDLRASVFDPIGETYSVVQPGVPGAGRGSLTLYHGDPGVIHRTRVLLESGAPLILRGWAEKGRVDSWHPDLTFAPVGESNTSRLTQGPFGYRILTVGYVTTPPILAGLGTIT